MKRLLILAAASMMLMACTTKQKGYCYYRAVRSTDGKVCSLWHKGESPYNVGEPVRAAKDGCIKDSGDVQVFIIATVEINR